MNIKKLLLIIALLVEIPFYAMKETKTLPSGAQHYIKILPTINHDTQGSIAEKIADFLIQHSGSGDTMQKEQLVLLLQSRIKQKKLITLIVPSFASRSSNIERKILGIEPDFGEFIALKTLNNIGEQINKVYKPGAHVVTFPYDFFLSDMDETCKKLTGKPLFKVGSVEKYQEKMRQLIALFDHVSIFHMDNPQELYTKEYQGIPVQPLPHIRDYITFIDGEIKQERIKNNIIAQLLEEKKECIERFFQNKETATQQKYNTLIKGKTYKEIQHNNLAYRFFNTYILSQLGVKNRTKELAQQLAQDISDGSQRVRKFMEKEIPNYKTEYIRASIHGSKEKLGLQATLNVRGTPWHKTPVVNKESVTLTDRYLVKKFPVKQYKYGGFLLNYVDATQSK
ncbi:L-tyrosine/L-tryptophan isonitrile synthase family protein [Candidatus Dependentiae bacterium]|nr:L-tyrosine/L-tryptophan isonitrile synthase family protein [Candidatus Dependentiae bacterium]